MTIFPEDLTQYRPVKVLLRVDILREADRAIQEGLGGYANRHEIVNDALEQHLIDLRYADEDRPAAPVARSKAERLSSGTEAPKSAKSATSATSEADAPAVLGESAVTEFDAIDPITNIAETAIEPPARGAVVENEIADVKHIPQLGLHNRDVPSLFGLAALARAAADGPVPMRAFYDDATSQAWRLAAALEDYEREHRSKVTVMMPRNRAKPQSASEGFQFFALGQVNRRFSDDGKLTCFGPLYQWGVAGLVAGPDGEVLIGMTSAGWDLLEATAGVDFGVPHDPAIARRFLAHLQDHSPGDVWGFRTALDAIAGGVGRLKLNEHFRSRLSDDFPIARGYTDSVAESTAQGYLSRSRAWGLVEPKLSDGQYAVTDFGREILDELLAGQLKRSTTMAAA